MSKLIRFYTSLLKFYKYEVNENGEVINAFSGESDPVELDGKVLLLPTKENLRRFDPDKVLIFHPLKEFVNRGESTIVRHLRGRINTSLNLVTTAVSTELMRIAGTPALHATFSPEQREILKAMPTIDVDTPAKYSAFAAGLFKKAPQTTFFNIYLKNSGTFRGEKHARVGIVAYEWENTLNTHGGKLSGKAREAYLQLLDFMFPGLSDESQEAYNGFSDSRGCPWLDCLSKTSYNLAQRLNTLIDLYGEFFIRTDAADAKFPDDWIDLLDDPSPLSDELLRIPNQLGNEGEVVKPSSNAVSEAPPTPQPSAPASMPVPDARSVVRTEITTHLPPARTVPPPTSAMSPGPQLFNAQGRPVDQYGRPLPPPAAPQLFDAQGRPVDQYGRPIAPQAPQAPVLYNAQGQAVDQYGRPVPQGYGQQRPPQAPASLITEDNKLDFDAVMSVSPMAPPAMGVMPSAPGWGPPQGYGVPVQDPRLAPSSGYFAPPPVMMDAWGHPMQPQMQGQPMQTDPWGRPVAPSPYGGYPQILPV